MRDKRSTLSILAILAMTLLLATSLIAILLDMAITTVIAVVATGFSFVIFKRVQD